MFSSVVIKCNNLLIREFSIVKFMFSMLLLFVVIVGSLKCENSAHASEILKSNNDHSIATPSFTDDNDAGSDTIETLGVVTNTDHESITEPMRSASMDPIHEVPPDVDDDRSPSEVQKAVCTVTAGDVKASAEAVTTKVLKGVCGSDEMNFAIKNLEFKLYKELQDIKSLLKQHLQTAQNRNIPYKTEGQQKHKATTFEKSTENSQNVYDERNNPTTKEKSRKITHPHTTEDDEDAVTTPRRPTLKSLPRRTHVANAREHEVLKFNNTILSDRDLKVFTYYWKLENVSDHIANGASTTLESPIFSIKGKPLHIKAFFHHLNRDFLFLQLEYAFMNTSNSNSNNIVLDTDGLFKDISSDKIFFKYKISILDQNNQRALDLVSQEFINFESGFFVPNSALLASSYLKQNSLLVQIFLYL